MKGTQAPIKEGMLDEIKKPQQPPFGNGFGSTRISAGKANEEALRHLQHECWSIAEEHGFHDVGQTFGDKLMLLVCEASEAMEEFRKGSDPGETWYKSSEEGTTKPEGIPSELADIMIRVLDTAETYGIDLGAMVVEKCNYNRTRPHLHGKTM